MILRGFLDPQDHFDRKQIFFVNLAVIRSLFDQRQEIGLPLERFGHFCKGEERRGGAKTKSRRSKTEQVDESKLGTIR